MFSFRSSGNTYLAINEMFLTVIKNLLQPFRFVIMLFDYFVVSSLNYQSSWVLCWAPALNFASKAAIGGHLL